MNATGHNPAGVTRDDAGGIRRVAAMLDELAAGDVTTTINGLEGLLERLRTAEAARDGLAEIDNRVLKAALVLRRHQLGGARR